MILGSFWIHECPLFSIAAHQSAREYMEDRMFCLCDEKNKFSIFSIFDGHGGDFVSKYLEEHFTNKIRERLLNTDMTKSEIIKRVSPSKIFYIIRDSNNFRPSPKKLNNLMPKCPRHIHKRSKLVPP